MKHLKHSDRLRVVLEKKKWIKIHLPGKYLSYFYKT